MNKKTKIVCTIGPTSDSTEKLALLLKNGMNVARLNFSHNTHAYHLNVLKKIRALSKKTKTPIGIIVDLQGPRIRLGNLPVEGINLVKGKKVILTTSLKVSGDKIPVTYQSMHRDMKVGERVLITDGLMELKVESIQGHDLHCRVICGGKIYTHKGVNLPDTDVKIDILSAKDKEDVVFAIKNSADFIALSFVRHASDVWALRKLIEVTEKKISSREKASPMIIVKIERREAVNEFDEILSATDAVMVARGDLGVELPVEDVPVIQKMIIDKCLKASKPVIVATQMLDSMISNPRPTRAEVSDVANAVIDHTDAVMLSGETASGAYPVEAVATMSRIIMTTEASVYDDLYLNSKIKMSLGSDVVMGRVAKLLSQQTEAKLILGATITGQTARIVSRFRPEKPIYMACIDERVLNQLTLSWGVNAFRLPLCHNVVELMRKAELMLKKQKVIKSKDQIVIITGLPVNKPGQMNLVELREV